MSKKRTPEPEPEEPAPPSTVFARPYVEGFDHLDPDTYDFEHCYTRTYRDKPYDTNDVVMAILKTGGNLGAMSVLLGRNRQRIKDYILSHQDARDILLDVVGANIDDVEQGAMQSALLGDGPQQRFLLSTLGKDRGYSTRVENTGRGGGPMISTNLSIDTADPLEASRIYQQLISGE